MTVKKKSKKQLEKESFEELKKRALEPFRSTISDEDIMRHEERIRNESMKNVHKMREELSDEQKKAIQNKSAFEHRWS